MLNKIYFLLLAIAVLLMCVLAFMANNWLASIGEPKFAATNYESYTALYWTCLWISSAILLVFSNVLMWMNRQAWSLWLTFGYFSVFVLLQTFWLEGSYLAFKQKHSLTDATFSALGLFGAFLCIGLAVGTFFNQFIVTRLSEKMFGEKKKLEEEVEVISEEVN